MQYGDFEKETMLRRVDKIARSHILFHQEQYFLKNMCRKINLEAKLEIWEIFFVLDKFFSVKVKKIFSILNSYKDTICKKIKIKNFTINFFLSRAYFN